MSIEVYLVDAVIGSKASSDGSFVDIVCKWTDGETFILRLPVSVANGMQIAVQDAASDAARLGGNEISPVIAEGLLLQASPVPGQELLTLRTESGMQLQYLVPAGRYDRGIPKAPDA